MTPVDLLTALATLPGEAIGRSVEDRPIVAVRIGPTRGTPSVLFGAIHGDEPLGAELCLRLVDSLAGTKDASIASTWIVPVANPDGFLRGQKNNARDVDLNRNFAAQNWCAEHRPGYFPGERPESEPETQALVRLIAQTGARRLLAIHSPFRVVNYDGPARPLAERIGARCGYPISDDIGYPTPGSFGSRFGRDEGREVITLEVPPMTAERAFEELGDALRAVLEP